MSTSPIISAKAKLIAILAAADFSGAGNVQAHKVDTFEKPGASVHLANLTSERETMSGVFIRQQMVQVTVQETVTSGDPEDVLLGLALAIEAAVETALASSEFDAGICLQLDTQRVEILPDAPSKGVITQIYSIDYTQTLTT